MKKLQLLFIAFFLSSAIIAQVPNAINYQAVARNNSGLALANQAIKVRLSIMSGASALYSETRSVTTNALGLFNVQIGSAGAATTSGNFATIDWANNTPNAKMIKVELDISNSGAFTDMGTQALATVPYSFAATQADNAKRIGGFNVSTLEPNAGDLLKFDGTTWQPVPPKNPDVYSIAGTIQQIAFGGGSAPWTIVGTGQYATVTVVAGQKITANFVGVFGHGNANPQPCSFSVCYEPVVNGVPTGVITSFHGNNYTDATIAATGNKTALSATGGITLPAGTYRIFMGFKNKSTNVNFGANDYVNGTVIVF